MTSNQDRIVLAAWLHEGLTHREIDLVLGRDPSRSKGWYSFRVLREEYGLTAADRGCLFLDRAADVRRVISSMLKEQDRGPLDVYLEHQPEPPVLASYRETWVLARNDRAVQAMLNGEARNLVQRFFSNRKSIVGRCQWQACQEKARLETVHLASPRPELFRRAARQHATAIRGGLARFDVHETMKSFLRGHMGLQYVAFMCRPHHHHLERLRQADPPSYRGLVRMLVRAMHLGTRA